MTGQGDANSRVTAIKIDMEAGSVTATGPDGERSYPMASAEAFKIVSDAWLRCAWDTRYSYNFSWLGRPIIQLPEDMVRLQEVIYRVKPDVIIETGVAHGGGQVFMASLCHSFGRGRIIGVELELRPRNREAIMAHALARYITLVDGSSTDPRVVTKVRGMIRSGETVLVVLDSNHAKDHVLAELEAYGPMITPGSYIVATDGVMEQFAGAPGSKPDWLWNNPKRAVEEFLQKHLEFALEIPVPPFEEGLRLPPVTHWPSAYLRRRER